ncbi:pentatricopeptide repeat-containing protein At5g66520-like [Impatiens glandulifera]|uniref:pentatricopeptide repeat-containing protein At5g66520-like n=1 Tax=Impatiens glandulifera TaxID=253017 RepID=UPI001FB16C97|nr:pentatricopeptide repeat-containing protein At5g66520-like [Impatiens glandulifera]
MFNSFKSNLIFSFSRKPISNLNFSTLIHHLPPHPSLRQTQQFHAHIISAGLAGNPHQIGSLIAALSHSPKIPSNYVSSILNHAQISTVFAANNLIRCFAKTQSPLQSIELYAFMTKHVHLKPNKYTYPFLFQACAKALAITEGFQIHTHILLMGFDYDVYIRNSLIHLYSSCSMIDFAQRVFDDCSQSRDIVTWNSLLGAYSRNGQIDIALKLFDEMPERDLISWTIKINGHVQSGQLEEALTCFQQLKHNGLTPNEAIFVTILSATAQLGLLDRGREIHKFIDSSGFPLTIPIQTGLIDMYAKCGSIEEAKNIFNIMSNKGISTWNAMICGLASHSHEREALKLFESFLKKRLRPDNVTFIGVLNACSRAGLVNEGEYYFKMMTDTYEIKPEMEHFGCMVDLLGRAGLVEKAIRLIEDMPVKPESGLWATLLGACKIHGEVELGERIGRKVIELDPNHDGHYVQLSGIYANARKWDDVVRVRRLMRDRKGNKGAGWSLIEDRGKVHRFVVGDREHKCSSDIYGILEIIGKTIVENVSSIR